MVWHSDRCSQLCFSHRNDFSSSRSTQQRGHPSSFNFKFGLIKESYVIPNFVALSQILSPRCNHFLKELMDKVSSVNICKMSLKQKLWICVLWLNEEEQEKQTVKTFGYGFGGIVLLKKSQNSPSAKQHENCNKF